MMTTGRVGGCSCGRVVSSRRGMAAAWARAGTGKEHSNRGEKKLPEISAVAHSMLKLKAKAHLCFASATVPMFQRQII